MFEKWFSREAAMDYQAEMEKRVDAFLAAYWHNRRAPVGTISTMKVELMRSLIKVFDLANEVVDQGAGGSVYVAYPYPISFESDKWPWLKIVPCNTDGAYTRFMHSFRQLIAEMDRDQLLGEPAASALVLALPRTLEKRTKIQCAKLGKESLDGKFPMRVFTIEV